MRIWFDITAPAHVLVFRPIIALLRASGHEVTVTSRDYTQTQQLLELHGIEHTPFGRHGGVRRSGKLAVLASRTAQLIRFGRSRGFDLAVAHGSNDLALAAAALRLPEVNMFDYEWATQQHNIGCRLASRVMTPDSIPAERLARYGASRSKVVQFPGLKEEYYLADFEPSEKVLDELGLDTTRVIVVVRPPPDISLYHRKANTLLPRVLDRLGREEGLSVAVLPRTEQQRRDIGALAIPNLVVAPHAVDAQSLIALSDLVVSAGGTMNREAVALGVPVYTTYGGRLGGVDEHLIRAGRLRPLTDPRAIEFRKRPPSSERLRRDPQLLVDRILDTAALRRSAA
jgi:predicted glycosyltransferase